MAGWLLARTRRSSRERVLGMGDGEMQGNAMGFHQLYIERVRERGRRGDDDDDDDVFHRAAFAGASSAW
jgi:hypothetical protein